MGVPKHPALPTGRGGPAAGISPGGRAGQGGGAVPEVLPAASCGSFLARRAALSMMFAAGGLLAVQSQANGQLAVDLGADFPAAVAAALISFAIGLIILSVRVALRPSGRAGVRRLVGAVLSGRLPAYRALAGLLGAFFIASQGLAVGTIGIASFVVAFTAGQTIASAVLDRRGTTLETGRPLSVPRVVAALFAIAAVIIKSGDRLVREWTLAFVPLVLLALVSGILLAVQHEYNGSVSAAADAWTATWCNYLVGTIGLVVVFLASIVAGADLDRMPSDPRLYCGGMLGVLFVWTASWTVHVHGVLVLGLCLVAGQVTAAETLEQVYGPAASGGLGIAASALAVCGVVVAIVVSTSPTVGRSASPPTRQTPHGIRPSAEG